MSLCVNDAEKMNGQQTHIYTCMCAYREKQCQQ